MSNVLDDVAFDVGDIEHRPPGVAAGDARHAGVLVGCRPEGQVVANRRDEHLYADGEVLRVDGRQEKNTGWK